MIVSANVCKKDDYNAFDYVQVLQKEIEQEKQVKARMAKDQDENELDKFTKQEELKQ